MAVRVLYLVSLFPCWSETFIVRELHALVRQGLAIRIASLRPHREPLVQPDAEALRDWAIYPSPWPLALARALAEAARRPARSLAWLGRITWALWRHPRHLVGSYLAALLALDLARRLRRDPPDRIHAHFATYPSTAAMILAESLGVPFSFTCHAHDIFLEDHLLGLKLARADFVVTISAFNIGFLEARLGALPRRPAIVHCGVDPKAFAFTRAGRGEQHIVSVGRLDEIKGFAVLVEACARLKADGIAFGCTIIGEGEQRPLLERLIAAHGLSGQVRLAGLQGQAEVRRQVQEATLFALPSVRDRLGNMDGIPVALMEAMALGTPVVTTRLSGIPELVEHRVSGWLCAPGDAAELAEGLRSLLADPALRDRLADNARAKIERDFDCGKEADKLAALLRQERLACAA
jgi:glycosyltransferase involved in cell wall biosynthesis